MTDRAAQIDELLTAIRAALMNVQRERAKDGDAAAVRWFVEAINVATQKLAAYLDGLAPHVEDPAVPKFEAARMAAIAVRIRTLQAEVNALADEAETVLGKVKAMRAK